MERFRTLRADEIEVRVAKISEKGVSLLLYKNARADMSVLDETVGARNWQRKHYDCKGNLFCSVGINVNYKDSTKPPLWVWKDDAGEETFASKEKGEASDSFKRACFNWGIGRELYTAPFIWVPAKETDLQQYKNKYICRDKFWLAKILIDDTLRQITALAINNKKGHAFVWQAAKNE